jgi:hypothetical protein
MISEDWNGRSLLKTLQQIKPHLQKVQHERKDKRNHQFWMTSFSLDEMEEFVRQAEKRFNSHVDFMSC